MPHFRQVFSFPGAFEVAAFSDLIGVTDCKLGVECNSGEAAGGDSEMLAPGVSSCWTCTPKSLISEIPNSSLLVENKYFLLVCSR